MRILCIIESIAQGGAERQLIGLASMLAQTGNKVKLITYNKDMFYLPLIKKTGVEFDYLEKASNKIRRIPTLVNYIKQNNPDIIITFLGTPSIIACIAKIIVGHFRLIVSERNTTQKVTLADRIRFFLYRFADWVVPNSYTQRDFIGEHYPSLREKTVSITNFSDTDYFRPKLYKSVEKRNIIKMVSVARICEQKNVKLFIDAVKKVVEAGASIQVEWYGMAFHPYSDECTKKVKDMGLEELFHFHKETNDVKSVYQNADVFVLPSVYEGFPNVLCEAMCCGLPVLCSNVCDNGRIARNGENGLLFNPLSVDEMAAAMISFCKLTKKEREIMGKKSREFALVDFSIDSFFKKYKKLIYEHI